MHWNRTVEPISPLITQALARLLLAQSDATSSSSSLALQHLSFHCTGTLKLTWDRKSCQHKWCVNYEILQPNTLGTLLKEELVISSHFQALTLHMAVADVDGVEETLLVPQLFENSTLLSLVLTGHVAETTSARGDFCAGRNQVHSLAVANTTMHGLWARALGHLQQRYGWNVLAISVSFLALRHSLEKVRHTQKTL